MVDSRAQWARRERFQEAAEVRCLALPETAAERSAMPLQVAREDAVVIMTHSFEQDRAWMAAVLPSEPRYLGVLGARHRSALLLSEAAAQLGWSVERACAGVFAPVGLDLGGDGAEAIALGDDRGSAGLLRRQAGRIAAVDAGSGGRADSAGRCLALSADAVCGVSIAGVILAAGASRRLGRPKQKECIGGETLLGRTIRTGAGGGARSGAGGAAARRSVGYDGVHGGAQCGGR